MSDLHHLPLMGHDAPYRPVVRGKVFSTSPGHWWWGYHKVWYADGIPGPEPLRHGPFASWREAYDSARRMVELL